MKRICAVCRHDRRQEIEAAILEGANYTSTAEQFGVHRTQLWRHMTKHLPRAIEKAQAQLEAAEKADLLSGATAVEQVRSLQQSAARILTEAEASGDRDTALKAIRELRSLTELAARFSGEDRPKVEVSQTTITINPVWLNHESAIDAEYEEEEDGVPRLSA